LMQLRFDTVHTAQLYILM